MLIFDIFYTLINERMLFLKAFCVKKRLLHFSWAIAVGSKGGLIMLGAAWAVTFVVWAIAASMWAVTGAVWYITASMWTIAASMRTVTDTVLAFTVSMRDFTDAV